MHHQNIVNGGVAPGVLEGVEREVCLEGDLVLILDPEGDLLVPDLPLLGLEAPAGLDSSPCLLDVIKEG